MGQEVGGAGLRAGGMSVMQRVARTGTWSRQPRELSVVRRQMELELSELGEAQTRRDETRSRVQQGGSLQRS